MFNFFRNNKQAARQKQLSKLQKQQQRHRRKIEEGICATIARGNVSLQTGEYITSEDLDALRAKLTDYFFSEQSKW